MIPILTAVLFVLVVSYWGLPLLWALAVRARLKRDATRLGRLLLTFDDGPGSRLTPLVLDRLRQSGSKATFFLLGRNVRGREDLVRRILAEGHEVGTHGYSHLHYWKAGPLQTLRDIRRGWQTIDRALGRTGGIYPFRPPYGELNLACLLYLWVRRMPIVYWTYDSGDTWPAQRRETQWARWPVGAPDAAVVLIHDFDRTSRAGDGMILEVVDRFLLRAAERKTVVTTLSRFLQERRAGDESVLQDGTDPSVVMRRADVADLNALLDICRSSFPDSLKWRGPRGIAAKVWRRWLDSDSCVCSVCCRGTNVLGFAVLVSDCTRYGTAPQARVIGMLDSVLLLLWHPVLAMRKALWALSRRRTPAGDTGVRSGVSDARPDCTWIELVAVRPDVRGKGLGTMMLEYCAGLTGTLGRDTMKLKVHKDNGQALKAYKRAGFEVTAEDADSYTCAYLLHRRPTS